MSATPVATSGELPPALGSNLVNGYIDPAMRRFSDAAGAMHKGLQDHCAKPAAPEVGKQFLALVQAWSGIQFLRFGPLVDDNRFERIYFWPDPRGMMQRQLQRQLAQNQSTAGQPDMATYSVAIQGLPALEYLLFRENGVLSADGHSRDGFERDCRYSQDIARNLARVGGELVNAWKPAGSYAGAFAAPSASNALYRNELEVAAETIKALSTGIKFLNDVQLVPALGKAGGQFNQRRLPFWRSGYSDEALAASARGMADFHAAGRFAYSPAEAWIGETIEAELRRVADALGSGGSAQSFRVAALQLQNAKSLVDQDMAPAFGARVGFNALDGD